MKGVPQAEAWRFEHRESWLLEPGRKFRRHLGSRPENAEVPFEFGILLTFSGSSAANGSEIRVRQGSPLLSRTLQGLQV